ncbi:GntR family transcriptional regulator [Virgibacillus byunsanensis]|uniref:GntR family transcriptional regulator n=1 Tax=Virgibacillus byunsanensis TaxID=570945 RepID=A0ABW3LJQ1_9BACI
MLLDKGQIPSYKQISKHVRGKIVQGEWGVGQKIPTETELGKQFNVSRITVVKALERLVEEGYLKREQAKGTFVNTPPLGIFPSELLSTSESITRKGEKPGFIVLENKEILPSARIVKLLGLCPNDKVWKLKQLFLANDEIIGIQISYFLKEDFPEVDKKTYNINIDSALETCRAIQLDEEEQELLQVKDVTGFSVERLFYLEGKPVKFDCSIMRSDRVDSTIKLKSTLG